MRCKFTRSKSVDVKSHCGNKICHRTYSDAFAAAKAMFKEQREKLVPYKCQLCNSYHIGHQLHEKDLSTAFVSMKKLKRYKINKSQIHDFYSGILTLGTYACMCKIAKINLIRKK
jgi:hypothetical protein